MLWYILIPIFEVMSDCQVLNCNNSLSSVIFFWKRSWWWWVCICGVYRPQTGTFLWKNTFNCGIHATVDSLHFLDVLNRLQKGSQCIWEAAVSIGDINCRHTVLRWRLFILESALKIVFRVHSVLNLILVLQSGDAGSLYLTVLYVVLVKGDKLWIYVCVGVCVGGGVWGVGVCVGGVMHFTVNCGKNLIFETQLKISQY